MLDTLTHFGFSFLGTIRLAAFVSEHNLPFAIMDHLPKLIQAVCPDSKVAAGLKCAKTKTHQIVENIVGKISSQDLCLDLRQSKFSLIIDESTDLSTIKHLCLVVRYFKKNRVVDSFLDLIPLETANAASLFDHIVNCFTKNNIDYKENLIGFASDGANVMMGRNNSVVTLLQNEVPHLFILKCICHSFNLCASYACVKLPRFVEDLVRDIHNYFSSSPKRVVEFKIFQDFCNVKVHKMLHPSQTRWLSVNTAVKRVLEQFLALKLFFTDQVANNDLLISDNILRRLKDPTTILFLQFLDFVLPFFTELNREMQAEHPKIHLVYSNICRTLRTLFDCFLKRDYIVITEIENVDFKDPTNFLDINEVYCGAKATSSLMDSKTYPSRTPDHVQYFKLRCRDFYIEACQQIIKRFPLKNNPLKELGVLKPENVKGGQSQSIIPLCTLFPKIVNENDFQQLDTEWRILRNIEEINTFSNDIELFWENVASLRNGNQTIMFPLLTKTVFTILSLPHSSANVERIFSVINILKTKQRNRLSSETIVGLLHSQRFLKNSTCYDFEIPQNMIGAMSKEYWYDHKDN